jgi:hypothetical protein
VVDKIGEMIAALNHNTDTMAKAIDANTAKLCAALDRNTAKIDELVGAYNKLFAAKPPPSPMTDVFDDLAGKAKPAPKPKRPKLKVVPPDEPA